MLISIPLRCCSLATGGVSWSRIRAPLRALLVAQRTLQSYSQNIFRDPCVTPTRPFRPLFQALRTCGAYHGSIIIYTLRTCGAYRGRMTFSSITSGITHINRVVAWPFCFVGNLSPKALKESTWTCLTLYRSLYRYPVVRFRWLCRALPFHAGRAIPAIPMRGCDGSSVIPSSPNVP